MKTTGCLYLLIILFTFNSYSLEAQKMHIKSSNISFFSDGLLEDIAAVNTASQAILNLVDGTFVLRIPITSFEFPNQLMQEHFNENYMESTKYPKATFSGMIENIGMVEVTTDGTYSCSVSGKLSMKDVTKEVSTTATFTVKGGIVNAKAVFNVNPADYNVEIPRTVINKISDNIKISIDADYAHQH